MNKLLLNERARNHIRFFPMKNTFDDIPSDAGEKIKWCESKFKALQHSNDAHRLSIHKHRTKGYMVTVWEFDGLYYLVQCLRNEFKTFNTTIYISKDKQDMINIAAFIEQNIETIMSDYKQQILDARDALIKANLQNEDTNGEA